MESDAREEAKRRAGRSAAEVVADDSVVGLGSGSTAAHAIRAIGRRVDALDVTGVPTSFQAADLAREAGIPLATPDDVDGIDLAIDGADQVAGADLIKGGGAAHAREKLVDAFADQLLVVVDSTKLAEALDRPVPVEVLPDARRPVRRRIDALDGEATLRTAERKSGPVVTDNGNLVLDCAFGRIEDPSGLSADLSSVPGVVEHGLFVGIADEMHVGTDDGVDVRQV